MTHLPYYRFQLVDREAGEEHVVGVVTNAERSWRVGDVVPARDRVFQITAIEPFEGATHIPVDAKWVVRRVA